MWISWALIISEAVFQMRWAYTFKMGKNNEFFSLKILKMKKIYISFYKIAESNPQLHKKWLKKSVCKLTLLSKILRMTGTCFSFDNDYTVYIYIKYSICPDILTEISQRCVQPGWSAELGTQQSYSFATTTTRHCNRASGTRKILKIFRSRCLDGVLGVAIPNIVILQ